MKQDKVKILKKAGNYIGGIVAIVSVFFIGVAIYKIGFDFSLIKNIPIFIAVSIVCVLIKTATVYMMGTAWTQWLSFFSKNKCKTIEAECVYAKANIGKYLPGNVMHYVERNLFAGKMGISQKKIAVSSLIEVLGLITVAAIISIMVSGTQLKDALFNIFGDRYVMVVVIAVILGVICVLLGVTLFRRRISVVIKEYELKDFIATLLKSALQYALVLILLGVIMVILYLYMGGDVTLRSASLIISGYIIAWVLGFVVPGAPGGIGVRELVVTVLLGPIVGKQMVLTLSVTHRLITVIGDFIAYLFMLVIQMKIRKK